MRISDWSSDVCSSDLRGHWASCVLSWRNQSPIDRGEDFRRSNDRSIRFDPLRIAIDQLIDMRAEQDSETHPFLHHVDDPVVIARRLQIGRASCREGVCKYV